MSILEDKKVIFAHEVVPMMSKITEDELTSPNYLNWKMMSKITEDELTSPNYLNWSKTIRLYLRCIRFASHLN